MVGNAEMDRLLAIEEDKKLEQQALRTKAQLDALDDHVTMLKAMGVQVSIVLRQDDDEAKNSLEVGPADARCKIYYKDLADLKVKLKEAQEGIAEAKALGLGATPKAPKVV